jgi:DNA topoisomerase VI subunit B
MKELRRATFEIGRELEFFSEKELTMQIGYGRELWPVALLKELIDNALDACELAGITPEVNVKVESDSFSAQDNGPGLPAEVLSNSLNYLKRVSDKAFYVSPTRGQLGNALKCIWAAPFVASGEHGKVEVWSQGQHHTVDVSLDRIGQRPVIKTSVEDDPFIKNGTLVKIHLPDLAGLIAGEKEEDSYNSNITHAEVVQRYSAFNPHATFRIGENLFESTAPEWKKWRPTEPTSPHWYNPETLRDLIAAYISRDRNGDRPRTVRDFVSEFRGLSGSAKQKQMGLLKGTYLHDFIKDGDIDMAQVESLLESMKKFSVSPKPAVFGIICQEHFKAWMIRHAGISEDSFKYARRMGDDGLPYVLEVAFGLHEKEGRRIITGLNWAPTLVIPTDEIDDLFSEMRIDRHDPVTIIVHIARPRFDFTDRGKTRLKLGESLNDDLNVSFRIVGKEWKRAKRQADRQDRISESRLRRMRYRPNHESIRDVAFEVMEAAYMKASGDRRYPANARQIHYAARPWILERTGNDKLNSSYFTQTLLKDYLDDYSPSPPWDVVWDARGHFTEPHTGDVIGLGGLEVRNYISSFTNGEIDETPAIGSMSLIRTSGPHLRYGSVLFIEKEGFGPLLEAAHISEKYDMANTSTKGMPVAALSDLISNLKRYGIKIYAVHDFDKSGFSILSTLKKGARGSTGSGDIVDLGFRLQDISGLEREDVHYDSDPRLNLLSNGATQDEMKILCQGRWYGERVELNAMTSDQFIEWLERKLTEHGVKKVIPNQETLEAAYRRAVFLKKLQEWVFTFRTAERERGERIEVPKNLSTRIEEAFAKRTSASWDEVIWNLVNSKSKRNSKKGGGANGI